MNEYIPSENEHKKAFRIAPPEEDITYKVIQARTEVLRAPKLSFGAKSLFVFLLDLSLSPYTHVVRGVVTISATRLSESLSCCRESVFKWIRELVTAHFVWVDQTYMPNFYAMNRYHVTALDPQDQPRQLPTRDGLWGNGVRRPVAPQTRFVSKTADATTWEVTDAKGTRLVTKNAAGEKTVVEKTSRQNDELFRVREQNQPEACDGTDATGEFSRPEGSIKPHVTGGENLTPHEDKTAPVASIKPDVSRGKSSTPPVEKPAHLRPSRTKKLGLDDQRSKSKSSSKSLRGAGEPDRENEKHFLERLGALAVQAEGEKGVKILQTYGAQWRMRYREDREKAERVLADARATVRQGELKSSLGGFMNVLWGEFAGRGK